MQSQIKQVAGNSAWLLLARVSSQGLGFVFAVMVARFLGEAGLGQYSFISASIFLGNTLSSFGMDTLLIREVARQDKADKTLIGNATWLQLGISFAYIIVLQLIAGSLPLSTMEAITAIRVYSLALIPLAFFSVFSAVLRGAERMDLFFQTNLVSAGIQVVFGALLLLTGAGILEIAILLVVTYSASALLSGWFSYRYIHDFGIDWHIARDRLSAFARQSLPFALLAVFGFLLQRMGVFTLGFLAGESETGFFSAAYRIIEGSKVFHFALLGALLPRLSQLNQNNDENKEIKAIDRTVFGFLLLIGIGIAVSLTIAAPFLITWIYGESYTPSILVLQIGIWILLPYAWTAKQSVQLVASGQENVVVKAHAYALIVAATVFPVLILAFQSSTGAGLATVISEATLAYWLYKLPRTGKPISQANRPSTT